MTLPARGIDDLIILGRGAPDVLRDGRVAICVAGWSPKLGFIRIYPTRLTSPLQQWNIVSVKVEQNPTDSRPESWKITGSASEWERLDENIQVQDTLGRDERIALIPTLASGCVSLLNESHLSLGIVHPTELRGYLSEREDVDRTVQRTLLGGSVPKTKVNYPLRPRMSYRCGECRAESGHDQQIIEIGCYEWFRKNPGKEAQVFENLRVDDPDFEKYLLVGNQANHRTSYLVIGVIRWKKSRDDTGPRKSA
jgi:hypothetical protein